MADARTRQRRRRAGQLRAHPSRFIAKLRFHAKIGGVLILSGALIATIASPPRPLLLWNATASSPVGLYWLASPDHVRAGDHVAAWAPDWARKLGAERRYIPLNVPLVKRVAATQGARLCLLGDRVFLNGVPAARRRLEDPTGRPMPPIEGCETLRKGEYFLFDAGQPDAFDGRYFGITSHDKLIGRARLIWRG
jgi:conjugative transfer signal peptidase TraF